MATVCSNITLGKMFAIDGVSYPAPKPSRSFLGNGISMFYAFAKGSSTSTSLDQDHESESSSIASADELWTTARDGLVRELSNHKGLVDQFQAEMYRYLITYLPQGGVNSGQSDLVKVREGVMPIGFKKSEGGSEDTLEDYLQKFMNSNPSMIFENLNEEQYSAFMNDRAANSANVPTSYGVEYDQAVKLQLLFAPGQRYCAIRTSPFQITSIEKELAGEEKRVALRNKLITKHFEEKLRVLDNRILRFLDCAGEGKLNAQTYYTNLTTAFCAVARLVPTVIAVRQQLIDMLSTRAHSYDSFGVVEGDAEVSGKWRKKRDSTGADSMV